jgi:hypothetical protein
MYERGVVDTDKFGILANYGVEKGGLKIYSFDFGDLSASPKAGVQFIKDLEVVNRIVLEQLGAVNRVLKEYVNKQYSKEGLFSKRDFYNSKEEDNFGRCTV